MKRVRLICIGVVLVGALCWMLSSRPASVPTLGLRSLGPTGSLWTHTNASGQLETGPRWSFAVTNSSQTPASWWAYLGFTDTNIPVANTVGMDRKLVHGRIAPRTQTVISMAVPSDTNIVWRGTLIYFTAPSQVELIAWPVVKHVPWSWLSNNFGVREEFSCYDEWHTTTNATTSR